MTASDRGYDRSLSCDVSIVIVNWNTREYLRDCLQSILTQTREPTYEVIVVDNASRDDSCAMLASEFPMVHVIANATNRGFACANNQGISVAKGRYVLLLNPDTIVLDAAIDRCIAYADTHSDVGIVGCQVLEDESSIQRTCFVFPSPLTILLTMLGLTRRFPTSRLFGRSEMGWWDRRDEREVDVVSGMFMLVRRAAVEQIGVMDEEYTVYAEEADWCYRFWKAGWRCVFIPHARIMHVEAGGKSTKQIPTRMFVQQQKSLLLFQWKNRGLIAWVATWLVFVAVQLIRIPVLGAWCVFDRQNKVADKAALAAAALKYHLLGILPES